MNSFIIKAKYSVYIKKEYELYNHKLVLVTYLEFTGYLEGH